MALTFKIMKEDGSLVDVTGAQWAQWFECQDNRRVALTKVGKQTVSTVFLGMEHGEGDFFETMVFPGCEICERYPTREEALSGHERIVAALSHDSN
jgi:hypothetical protein